MLGYNHFIIKHHDLLFLLLLYLQPQHPDRSVLALILGFVNAGFTCGLESTFLHHTARGRIVDKMSADERFDIRRFADMV